MDQPVREFVSLLVAAALAAPLGLAGTASSETPPSCAAEVGSGAHREAPHLYPAAALGAAQAEVGDTGRERGGGPGLRRVVPEADTRMPRPMAAGGADRSDAFTPCWLLGFPGNPTTAPPPQA